MKRLFVILICVVLTGVFVLGSFGCAKPAPAPVAKPAPAPAPTPAPGAALKPKGELKKTLVIGAAASGTSYIFSAAMVTILNRFSSFEASQGIWAGSTGRFKAMMAGECDLIPLSAMGPVMYQRGEQGPEMKKIRLRSLSAGGGLAQSYMSFYTLPDSGIKSVKDLRGKRVAIAELPAPQLIRAGEVLLKANGMTKDDVKSMQYSVATDAWRDLTDRRIDAFFHVMGPPTTELAKTKGLYIVPLTREEQAASQKDNPAVVGGIVPKDYLGASVDTPVITSPTVWWVAPHMSEITAYTILKTMYEHTKELGAIHPALTGFTLDNALSVWAIPYHPGSILYFKELGKWGPEEDKKQQELLRIEKELQGP